MRRRNMREARHCQNGAIGAALAAVLMLGLAPGATAATIRTPAVKCVRGDIELTDWDMTSSLFPGRDHRTIDATLIFEVKCTPFAAQLEMRLQRRMKVHGRYEYVTQGRPDIYTASGDPPGLIFPMVRDWVCARGRWQIFLHVLAGINHAHKPVPPENFYFPLNRKGFFFTCRKFQSAN